MSLSEKNGIVDLLSHANRLLENTMPDDQDHPIVVVEPAPVDAVMQTPMMKSQPTELDKIPIDEEGYAPTTADELSRAARMLLRELPDDVAAWAWESLKRLRDKVNTAIEDRGQMKTEGRSISGVRGLIRSMLLNEANPADPRTAFGMREDEPSDEELAALEKVMGDVDIDDLPDEEIGPAEKPAYGRGKPGAGKKTGTAVLGLSKDDEDILAMARRAFGVDNDEKVEKDVADVEADEEEAEEKKKKKYFTAGEEGQSLKDIAQSMGVSIAKIKNDLYGITMVTKYTRWLMDEHPEEYIDTMEEFALEYIDAMREAMEEEGGLTREDKEFLEHLEENPMDFVSSPEYAPQFRYFISGPKVGSDPEGPYRTKMRNDKRFHKYIFDLFRSGDIEKADLLAAGVKEGDFPKDVAAAIKSKKEPAGERADEARRKIATVIRNPVKYATLLEDKKFKFYMDKLADDYISELSRTAPPNVVRHIDSLRENRDLVLSSKEFKKWIILR